MSTEEEHGNAKVTVVQFLPEQVADRKVRGMGRWEVRKISLATDSSMALE